MDLLNYKHKGIIIVSMLLKVKWIRLPPTYFL